MREMLQAPPPQASRPSKASRATCMRVALDTSDKLQDSGKFLWGKLAAPFQNHHLPPGGWCMYPPVHDRLSEGKRRHSSLRPSPMTGSTTLCFVLKFRMACVNPLNLSLRGLGPDPAHPVATSGLKAAAESAALQPSSFTQTSNLHSCVVMLHFADQFHRRLQHNRALAK